MTNEEKAFREAGPIAAYKVGEIDALDKLEQKLKKHPRALVVVQAEKKRKQKDLTFSEFMLREGFYDYF